MAFFERLSWIVVRLKVRFNRGQSWLYFFKDILYISVGMAIIEQRFDIKFDGLYFIIPVCYVLGCVIIGYVDEVRGIWKKETIYGSKDLNPFLEQMDKKLDRLLEKKCR